MKKINTIKACLVAAITMGAMSANAQLITTGTGTATVTTTPGSMNVAGNITANNVQIGLSAPSNGVNILANFPTLTTANGWARGFSISNQSGAVPFLEFGVQGGFSSTGVSTFGWGYIGTDYAHPFMNFSAAGDVSVTKNLAVAGDINLSAVSTVQSPTQLVLRSGGSYLNVTPKGGVGLAVAGADGIAGSGLFYVNGSQTVAKNLTVAGNLIVPTDATQYVSIGSVVPKNVPGYKLFVDQGILTEKVKVAVATSAQWSDYVFAKEYKLMPLTEVEKFVKTNNHLPNVPSAAEMVKNGNNLGETDAKLLEKIEELTLYMIDMKKDNEFLKNKVQLLESKINK